jgi:voltage-dependent calcium channel L type alpha-1D
MAADHFGQTEAFGSTLEYINYLFALIFTLEALLKLLAYYPAGYFAEPWNRFDFLIVCGTNAGLAVKWITDADVGSVATIVRSFRIGRVLRLVKGAKGLRQLFNTLMLTLPSLSNIGSLLVLLLFIYAVSREPLERRWRAVRAALHPRGNQSTAPSHPTRPNSNGSPTAL